MQHGISSESDNIGETMPDVAELTPLASNSKELDRLDHQNGYAAIHYAAKQSDSTRLNVLLKAGYKNVNLPTAKKNTALHLAAKANYMDNLILLIEAQANLELKNDKGYTALHLAAHSHSLECVKILLDHHADPNTKDKDDRTPLHLALTKTLPTLEEKKKEKIIELLLDHEANLHKADKKGYTPLHIAAMNRLSRCVNVLIKHEADLSASTIDGISALSIILRNTPTSLEIFKCRLDESLTLIYDNEEQFMKLNFNPLLQHRQNQVSNLPEIGYLDAFVKDGYEEILEHPLCQSFLHFKRRKIQKYYLARMYFYFSYVLIFSLWMIVLARNCYKKSNDYNKTTTDSNNKTTTDSNNKTTTDIDNTIDIKILCYDNSMFKAVLAVLSVLEIFRKIIVILSYRSVRQFLQIENLIECFMIIGVFITLFTIMDNFVNDSKWHYLNVFTVICGWINLMLIIGQLSTFGVHVNMLICSQRQILNPFLVYVFPLIGFTVSFCILVPHIKSFSNMFIGFTKVLTMMSGELNEDFFFEEEFIDSTFGLFHFIVLFIFISFFLFSTIVLMNLLIGIAVNNIENLQKMAGLAKVVRQTKFIYNLEAAIIRFTIFLGSERFVKFMQRTMLPSSSLDVCVWLNSRDKLGLPQDIYEASYKIANAIDFQNIRDEKELKLIKIREAIEQQRELHVKKMKIAEAEEKIVLLKLLKEEEALRQTA